MVEDKEARSRAVPAEPGSIPIVGARPGEYRSRGAARPDVAHARSPRPNQGRADITLINMNLFYINMGRWVDYEIHPPLGLLYLTSVLEGAGYAVDLIDYQTFHRESPEADLFDLDAAVGSFGEVADVVGFSCMANLLPFTLLVARRLKELHPDKTVVLGGVGPFGVEELILKRFGWVDVIARGEAELTVLGLLEALPGRERLGKVGGICYRSNGSVEQTPEQPRIRDLDGLPYPAYHRLVFPHYDAFGVITARGCPYECSFCSVAPIWSHHASHRSHTGVIEEIRLLHEQYGVEHVLFQDEFFYSSEAKILDFCDRLEATGMPVTWKCFGRVNLVTEQAMRRMAEAGCVQLRFGIESACDSILDKVVKGFRFKDALRVVTEAVQIFPSVETFFIWGFPFEGMDDFMQTAIQMERFRQMGVAVLPSLLSLLPQTAIYDDVRAGLYPGELSLVPELVPVYTVTGHEVLGGGGNSVPERYRPYYDFIAANPDIFPGFFLFDFERNVLPKYQVLVQMGLA